MDNDEMAYRLQAIKVKSIDASLTICFVIIFIVFICFSVWGNEGLALYNAWLAFSVACLLLLKNVALRCMGISFALMIVKIK